MTEIRVRAGKYNRVQPAKTVWVNPKVNEIRSYSYCNNKLSVCAYFRENTDPPRYGDPQVDGRAPQRLLLSSSHKISSHKII